MSSTKKFSMPMQPMPKYEKGETRRDVKKEASMSPPQRQAFDNAERKGKTKMKNTTD